MNKRKLIILFLGILIISLTVVIALKSTHVNTININGLTRYTKEEFTGILFDKPSDKYAPLAYMRYKLFKQKSIPFVEYVEIELADKNTLSLQVYEKEITACIDTMGGYLYFDKDGVVVESTKERFEDVVVIKGLKFDRLVMNEPFEVQNEKLFKTVNDLCLLIKKNGIKADVAEFSYDYEVTLYVDKTVVQLGKKTAYDAELNELNNIISALENKKVILNMKDFEKNGGKVIAKPLE